MLHSASSNYLQKVKPLRFWLFWANLNITAGWHTRRSKRPNYASLTARKRNLIQFISSIIATNHKNSITKHKVLKAIVQAGFNLQHQHELYRCLQSYTLTLRGTKMNQKLLNPRNTRIFFFFFKFASPLYMLLILYDIFSKFNFPVFKKISIFEVQIFYLVLLKALPLGRVSYSVFIYLYKIISFLTKKKTFSLVEKFFC